jgi:hypothetical protein
MANDWPGRDQKWSRPSLIRVDIHGYGRFLGP